MWRRLFTGVHETHPGSLAAPCLRQTGPELAPAVRQLVDALPHAVASVDGELRFRHANVAYATSLGCEAPSSLVGSRLDELFGPEGRDMLAPPEVLHGQALRAEVDLAPVTGSERRLDTLFLPYRGEKEKFGGFLSIGVDITDYRRIEEALRRNERRFRALVQNSTDMIHAVDAEGQVLYTTPSVERILGRKPGEQPNAFHNIHPHDAEALQGKWQALLESPGTTVSAEFRVRHAKGHYVYVEAYAVNRLDDPEIAAIVLNSRDVTERHRLLEEMQRRALRDHVTDLPNRYGFEQDVDKALARAERYDHHAAVVLMDLDGFKRVNDTLGHATGDALLIEVAQRLRDTIRTSDTVARLGGDEFVMLATDLRDDPSAYKFAERLQRALSPPVEIEGYELPVAGSFGVAVYPRDGTTRDELLRAADAAMYRAKNRGRNRIECFSPHLMEAAADRLSLETDLRRATENHGLELHFQPQLRLADRRTVGIEALVRWPHPQRGYVSPAQLIPVAEQSGLILPLGEWVLREACRQQRRFDATGGPELQVAVNISAAQFSRSDFVDLVKDALSESGLLAHRLELEVTESVVMNDIERVAERLHQLRQLGVGVAIDDFGTGYSSLQYLQRLPFDRLKIDRSFVSAIEAEGGEDLGDAIIGSIVDLAQRLHLGVVAEGVETNAQATYLRGLGCEQAQGFLFARPMPLDRLREHVLGEPTEPPAVVPRTR